MEIELNFILLLLAITSNYSTEEWSYVFPDDSPTERVAYWGIVAEQFQCLTS